MGSWLHVSHLVGEAHGKGAVALRLTRTLIPVTVLLLLAIWPRMAGAQSCPALPNLPSTPFFNPPKPVITQVDANTVKVRIDAPPVFQPCTSFPQVVFKANDTVTVNAGGCVQTGGIGSTWKRYVNPSGDNSDRLYRGTIGIPTATQGGGGRSGLEPVQSAMAAGTLTVKTPPAGTDANSLILQVGYDDDNYGDNGYSSHDDGTEDQCRGVGNAFVELTITHHPAPQHPSPSTVFPMDLTWTEVDNNLLPLNPNWSFRVTDFNGGLQSAGALCGNFHDEGDVLRLGTPPCTSQSPTVNEPSAGFLGHNLYYDICQLDHPAGTVHGHVNWALASYTGNLFFKEWSGNIPNDNDYNFILERTDKAGMVGGNVEPAQTNGLNLEFLSNETIDHFDTPFWTSFHQAVDAGNGQAAIKGLFAVAVGVIGIDNQHSQAAELHPVLGMAMALPNNGSEVVWAVFARRSGNEGACSQDKEVFQPGGSLQGTSMSFFLPSTLTNVGPATIFRGTGPGTFGVKPVSGGVVLQLDLPQQGDQVAWGELHLQQNAARNQEGRGLFRLAAFQGTTTTPQHKAPVHGTTAAPPENDSLLPLYNKLTPQQKQIFVNRMKQLEPKVAGPAVAFTRNDAKVQLKQHHLAAGEAKTLVRSRQAPDPKLATHLANIHQALVLATGGEAQVNQLMKGIAQ